MWDILATLDIALLCDNLLLIADEVYQTSNSPKYPKRLEIDTMSIAYMCFNMHWKH